MNKEQILAIIQGGHTTDGDLSDALLAELAKEQEPSKQYALSALEDMDDFARMAVAVEPIGAYKVLKDYIEGAHPLPQPDLVAEIERLKEQYVSLQIAQASKVAELRQQLSAAQASESELLKALEQLVEGSLISRCYFETDWEAAKKAIATHKARKEGK